MDPRRLPIYLERDGLSNAMVNLSIETPFNQAHLINKILENNDHVATSEPLQKVIRTQKHPITKENKELYFLANSDYKMLITDDAISFNFVRQYPLWSNYLPFIMSCLEILDGDIRVMDITLRYVSEFEDISIFKQLDGSIKLQYLPLFDGSEFTFRYGVKEIIDGTEFQGGAIVKLTDKMLTPKGNISVADITVMGKVQENVGSYLNFLHNHERDLFFRIFKKEFFELLGAHYE